MTPNIAGALFNTLVFAFFAVIAIGAGLLAYAATALKKSEKNA